MIRCLCSVGALDVHLIAEREMDEYRIHMGMRRPDTGSVNVHIKPDSRTVDELLRTKVEESVHILEGIRKRGRHKIVFAAQQLHRLRCGAISEGADLRGLKGRARKLIYRVATLQTLESFDFLFAMGQNGVNWFKKVGWPREKLIPFFYATEGQYSAERPTMCQGRGYRDEVRLLSVAQLMPHKGLDIALEALASLKTPRSWRLSVVGSGFQRQQLHHLSQKLGIEKRVEFVGTKPNEKIFDLMANSDYVLLPSRFDGWGAVVNEALSCGTPVICSDHCGAKDLLAESWRGEIVPAGNIGEWSSILERRIEQGKPSNHTRQRIQQWAGSTIAGPVAARYFLSALVSIYGSSKRPTLPWLNHSNVDAEPLIVDPTPY